MMKWLKWTILVVIGILLLGFIVFGIKYYLIWKTSQWRVPPPDIPATAEDPIVLPFSELEIKHGDEATFMVNYYNDYNTGSVEPALSCTGFLKDSIATANMGGCKRTGDCDVVVPKQDLDSGEYKEFKFIIPADATGLEEVGLDVCEIKFCAPSEKGDDGKFINKECQSGNEKYKQFVLRVT